eukprot:CAMPEP_0174827196 /NCGR_PEP_ID=MMETSP1114-20130205/547_1 /TAXON_ID=312471 /ORGANISM="Neobodo designis, Strain CCAP 1951/1" /LENGTH=103 /DNA_ID=CAMNT_0016060803 /DNA_START=27 /DNA_END=335 /DNA_ORIENTATION=-
MASTKNFHSLDHVACTSVSMDTLRAVLAASDVAAAHASDRYALAHEAGTPIPAPTESDYRAVRRYDTADPEPKTLFHSKRPAPLPVAAVFENLAKRVPTFDAA